MEEIKIPDSLKEKRSTIAVHTAEKNLILALRNVANPDIKSVPEFISEVLVKNYFDSLDESLQKQVIKQTNLMNELTGTGVVKK